MNYKSNDAPDSQKVTVALSLGQVKYLDKMVHAALSDVENYGEDEFHKQKTLQKLCDVFFPILNIELTEAEKKASMEAWVKKFTKDSYERVHGVQP